MKFVGLDGLKHFWSKAKAYTDTVCCNTINRDTLCLVCSYACTNTKASCACTYSASCIGTMSTLCTTCAKAYIDTVCRNTINRDTLCLACSYACANTKALCSCTYAGSIGTSCKNAACAFAVTCSHTIGTSCKKDACTYADNIGTECKKDACAYTNAVSFCNINVCRGLSTIGTSTYCDSKCWGTDGNWAYLTFTEAPDNHWHYVIKMDGYDACRRAGLAFPADDFQQNGVYYKLDLCGGNDGWKLIPDITCVQRVALSCGKSSETCACTYANSVAGQCKGVACTYAHCTVNTCKGIGVMGVARNTNAQCWTEPGYWTYMTSLDGPTSHWYHIIKMDWNDAPGVADPWLTGISIPTYNAPNNGIYYKCGRCGGNDGWKLIPDITCVQRVALSCGKSSETCACTYANSVAGQCKGVACTYAHCTVNTCKGIGVMGVARNTNAQCWTEPGYWTYMTSLDGPTSHWYHIIKMDWNDAPGVADPWLTGISIPTYNAPNNGIYYKCGRCGGNDGWKLIPDITCVQTLSGSCASSIGVACKNAACAFAAACAASVVPETSTFAKCYGNSTSCVACADKVRINTLFNNVYYKIPFTSTNGTTPTSGCLSIDAYPSYNPVSQVSCVYTECVAKTLAVPNGNGSFRLGSYCIYIG